MSNIFGFSGTYTDTAGKYSGIEVDVGAGVEIALLAVHSKTGLAKIVVTAASLLNNEQDAVVPGAQFGTAPGYALVSDCYEGQASTFANPGDCFGIEAGNKLVFPIPLIVPAGRSLHILSDTAEVEVVFDMIFEERALGASAYLPQRGG